MSNNLAIKSTSLAETDSLAKLIIDNLKPNSVIAFNGDLGSGKTTFIKSLVRHSGNNNIVTSPTFAILNVYEGTPKFYHFDFYRLASLDDIENIGGEELIPATDGITLIEWANKIPDVLPDNFLQLDIRYLDETIREFSLKSFGNIIDLTKVRQQWQF